MIPNNQVSREALKHVALIIAGLIAIWGAFVMGWCALKKIYIDVPMLLVLSNIVTGIVSSITTILVGRTLAQLNQGSDDNATTQTTATSTVTTVTTPPDKATKPQQVIVANTENNPAQVQEVKP